MWVTTLSCHVELIFIFVSLELVKKDVFYYTQGHHMYGAPSTFYLFTKLLSILVAVMLWRTLIPDFSFFFALVILYLLEGVAFTLFSRGEICIFQYERDKVVELC